MKLWLIRHADPDYSVDSLTETGWAEAAALADYLEKQPIKKFYVSPLGRAKATAAVTLRRIGREAEELPWLREFPARPDLTDRDELQAAYPDQIRCGDRLYADVIWDMLPEYLADHPEYLDREGWRTAEAAIAAGMYYLRKASDHDDVVHVDAEVRDPAPSSPSSDEEQPRPCDSNTTDQGPTINA